MSFIAGPRMAAYIGCCVALGLLVVGLALVARVWLKGDKSTNVTVLLILLLAGVFFCGVYVGLATAYPGIMGGS